MAIKKCIPNILTSIRIIIAMILFLFKSFSDLFLSLYFVCMVTDILDGFLARKLSVTSLVGSVLDSIADVLTYFAFARILILKGLVPFWILLWLGATLLGFLISGLIAKKKTGKFYFVHSFFGKLLGIWVFLMPLTMKFIGSFAGIVIIDSLSTIAAIESIIIQIKNKGSSDTEMLTIKDSVKSSKNT